MAFVTQCQRIGAAINLSLELPVKGEGFVGAPGEEGGFWSWIPMLKKGKMA
ncbi:MAG: hypothetical protein ACI8T1_001841 [Verrucomicrobiales bacterium]|jgi:hypothetical protein